MKKLGRWIAIVVQNTFVCEPDTDTFIEVGQFTKTACKGVIVVLRGLGKNAFVRGKSDYGSRFVCIAYGFDRIQRLSSFIFLFPNLAITMNGSA